MFFGYDYNYVFIMMKYFLKDLLCINSLVINMGDVVFEENVLNGNVMYNVWLICVVVGEFMVFMVNGECFGLVFVGVIYYEVYGFFGNFMFFD